MGGREGRERRRSERERGERGKRGERASETPDLDLDKDNFIICLHSRIFLKIEARTRF